MTQWRSIVGISPEEQAKIMELADFGAVEFRARTMIEIDYEPVALAAKEAEIDEQRKAQQKENMVRLEADPSAIMPIGAPIIRGKKPWLNDVPMKREILENFFIPAALLPRLMGDPWKSGRGQFVHPDDDRQRGLFADIEFRHVLSLSKDTVSEASPLPAALAKQDVPEHSEIRNWISDFYERTGGSGGSRDWRRAGKADFLRTFPNACFDREYILQTVEDLGLKRPYAQDKSRK